MTGCKLHKLILKLTQTTKLLVLEAEEGDRKGGQHDAGQCEATRLDSSQLAAQTLYAPVRIGSEVG